jgi:hypothetical protein
VRFRAFLEQRDQLNIYGNGKALKNLYNEKRKHECLYPAAGHMGRSHLSREA